MVHQDNLIEVRVRIDITVAKGMTIFKPDFLVWEREELDTPAESR